MVERNEMLEVMLFTPIFTPAIFFHSLEMRGRIMLDNLMSKQSNSDGTSNRFERKSARKTKSMAKDKEPLAKSQ